MGSTVVDQIAPSGALLHDVDTTMSPRLRHDLLLSALPGSTVETYAGQRFVMFDDQVVLSKQVSYLGNPWEPYKKRIQIPKTWLYVSAWAKRAGLTVRFVGVYHHGDVTIFVDFDPETYLRRKANNSSAHVATNDLYQAQTLGQFSRVDKNGNRLTSVRADQFAAYLVAGYEEKNPHLEVLDAFSEQFLNGERIEGLAAVQEMHAANWPDKFQNEWAGFYVEYRLDDFVKTNGLEHVVVVQKEKRKGEFDYDLRLLDGAGGLVHYGDLKASNIAVKDSPGNAAEDFFRCLEEFGRFWYVIYEHETWHGRDNDDIATIAWNTWRQEQGHIGHKGVFDERSYAGRFKEAVRFVRVKVLEVNQANVEIVLKDFQKDFHQIDGGALRKAKVAIKKKDIDNFLIYTRTLEVPVA